MQTVICTTDEQSVATIGSALDSMSWQARPCGSAAETLEIVKLGQTRLLIMDWRLGEGSGLELCKAVRGRDGADYVYIVVLLSQQDAANRIDALYAGADDTIATPVDSSELLACLKTAERVLSLETRDTALFAMAKLAESRDPETGAHLERVQNFSRLLAQQLATGAKYKAIVDAEFIRLIFKTCPLHDIGKAKIPDAVLLKAGPLTATERAVMQTHVRHGVETLDAAMQQFPNVRFLRMAREIAATHHEKFDGTGYPQGLAGTAIPLAGRIVALADVYDALTSRRLHKAPMSHHEARAIVLKQSGKHFDPDVVEAFLQVEDKFIAVRDRLPDLPEKQRRAATALTDLLSEGGDDQASRNDSAIPTVLIVEDDAIVMSSLVKLLTQNGYAVLTAKDGAEALTVISQGRTRLVLSDWIMPGMDGLELCRRARAGGAGKFVHFIMLTIQTEKSRLLEAFDAGVDDFITKPFDPAELLVRLRVGCRAAQMQAELRRENEDSQQINAKLAVLNSRLEQLAITDDLTGLHNRRHATIRLEEHWALSSRYGNPLTVAMFDIDHFKRINDTFGHDAGDEVLRQVAGLLKQSSRVSDAVCRVGGEEFLVIFPMQSESEAAVYAERCRARLEAFPLIVNGMHIPVTCSVGLAARQADMSHPNDLIKASDDALYQAKRNGRNRILILQAESAAVAG